MRDLRSDDLPRLPTERSQIVGQYDIFEERMNVVEVSGSDGFVEKFATGRVRLEHNDIDELAMGFLECARRSLRDCNFESVDAVEGIGERVELKA